MAIGVTALIALLLAVGLLLFDRLQPTASIFLAAALTATAIGALWAARRVGRGGLWVGGATGAGYALLAWAIAGLLHLEGLGLLGVLQGLAATIVVGALAGIIGVNL